MLNLCRWQPFKSLGRRRCEALMLHWWKVRTTDCRWCCANVAGELQHHLRVCSAKYVFTSQSLASQTVQVATPLNSQV